MARYCNTLMVLSRLSGPEGGFPVFSLPDAATAPLARLKMPTDNKIEESGMGAWDTAALAAIIAALVGALASWVTARHQAKTEFAKLEREYMLQHQSEQLVRRLLQRPKWEKRSFQAIQKHVGGFAPDELRQILIRAGAVRFALDDDPAREFWGLIERNEQALSGS